MPLLGLKNLLPLLVTYETLRAGRYFMTGSRGFRALALSLSGLLISACVGIGGETIHLSHSDLKPPASPASGPIALPKQATGGAPDSKIGYATFTVFAIPDGTVRTSDSVGAEFEAQVAEALQRAGYQVQVFDEKPPEGTRAYVAVDIYSINFKNYNWLWPFVPTWGQLTASLSVRHPDGSTPYQKTLSASGHSFCLSGHCAYSHATQQAMTRFLDQVVLEATSQPFANALQVAPPPVAIAPEPAAPVTEPVKP